MHYRKENEIRERAKVKRSEYRKNRVSLNLEI